MKIRIIQCNNQLLWYSRHVGEVFEVQKAEPTAYWCLEPDVPWRLLNWVHKYDAEVIEDELVEVAPVVSVVLGQQPSTAYRAVH